MIIDVHDKQGQVVEQTELDDSVWAIEPNIPVMHQALLRQLANARLGTRDTKTRGEVPGGGAQPRRTKGTGRAVSFGAHTSGRSIKTCLGRCDAWQFARRSRQRCAMSV